MSHQFLGGGSGSTPEASKRAIDRQEIGERTARRSPDRPFVCLSGASHLRSAIGRHIQHCPLRVWQARPYASMIGGTY